MSINNETHLDKWKQWLLFFSFHQVSKSILSCTLGVWSQLGVNCSDGANPTANELLVYYYCLPITLLTLPFETFSCAVFMVWNKRSHSLRLSETPEPTWKLQDVRLATVKRHWQRSVRTSDHQENKRECMRVCFKDREREKHLIKKCFSSVAWRLHKQQPVFSHGWPLLISWCQTVG